MSVSVSLNKVLAFGKFSLTISQYFLNAGLSC